MKRFVGILVIMVLHCQFLVAQTTLLQEDFETDGEGTRYVSDYFYNGSQDFFARIEKTGASTYSPAIVNEIFEYSNQSGNFFFAGEDIDGSGANPQYLSFTGTNAINISGYTGLEVKILFASGTNIDIDNTDDVDIEVNIDGGGWTVIGQLRNDGSTFNTSFYHDADMDGVGEPGAGETILTGAFVDLTFPVGATGSSMELRIKLDGLTSGDEEVAFDNVRLEGASAGPIGTSTLTAGATAEAALFSSIYDSQAEAAFVFDFAVTDDGATPGTDTDPTLITDIVFSQGAGNDIADWTDVIAGAELVDQNLNILTGSIGATSITFSGIATTSGEAGYIADNASQTYELYIWLKTDFGVLATTIEGQNLDFLMNTSGITLAGSGTSSFASGGADIESGASNNAIDVEATQLSILEQPSNTLVSAVMAPSPQFAYTDENGNVDEDYDGSGFEIDITSGGTFAGTATTQEVPVAGIATFSNVEFSASATGITLSGTDNTGWVASPSIVSNTFDVNQAPSVLAEWILDTDATPSNVHASVNAGNFENGSGLGAISYGSSGAYCNGWSTGALDADDYFEITIAPNTGYTVTVSGVYFDERRSSTGIRDYQVQWSTDGFSTSNTIATVNVPDNDLSRTGDVSGLSVTVTTGQTLTIRFYGYNAEAGTGTWRINDNSLKILGAFTSTSTPPSSEVTTAAGVEPALISSILDTQPEEVFVFDFSVTDDGSNPSADTDPTLITDIVISQGAGNDIGDWTDVIAGAELIDQDLNIVTGVITATEITFNSIPTTSGQAGYIPDDQDRTYELYIWLKNDLGTLKTTIEGENLDFLVNNASFTVSASGSSGFAFAVSDIESGATNNAIDVEATQLTYIEQPVNTPVATVISPSPQIAYTDENGNVDEDYDGAGFEIDLTTAGTFSGTATTQEAPVAGIATFDNVEYANVVSAITITGTDNNAWITTTTVVSNTFDITQPPIVLADWHLETNSNPNTVHASVSASTFENGPGVLPHTIGTSGAYTSGWSTGALDSDDYFEVTISPNPGYTVNVSAVNFDERRSNSGIRDYQVQWSTDGFATSTTIAIVNVPDNDQTRTADLTGLSIPVVTGETLTIRFFGYNAESSGGTWRIGDNSLEIIGTYTGSAPQASTVLSGSGTEPGSIESIYDTQAEEAFVFDFLVTDDGSIPATDNDPLLISEIVISQGTGNAVADWTDVIAGAELWDQDANFIAGVVGATDITFNAIPNGAGELGNIADDDNETFELYIWLKDDMGAYKQTIDGTNLAFMVNRTSFSVAATGSSDFASGSGADVESGSGNNAIEVNATELQFEVEPTDVYVSYHINPAIEVIFSDVNGNYELDLAGIAPVRITASAGALVGSPVDVLLDMNGIAKFSTLSFGSAAAAVTLTAIDQDDWIGTSASAQSITFDVIALPELFISEIADPSDPGTGYQARFVELYNAGSTPIDLQAGNWHLCRQANYATTNEWADAILKGIILPGETYVIANDSNDHFAYYGVYPHEEEFAISGNGNDAYFLYYGGDHTTGTLIDAYGVYNQDGNGQPWYYEDSRIVRSLCIINANAIWTASEWNIYPATISIMTPGERFPTVWLGNTDEWSNPTNWTNGTPCADLDITIPAAPVGGEFPQSNFAAGAAANSVTLEPGVHFTIPAGQSLTISNDFVIQSDATATASLIELGTLSIGGTGIVERYLTEGGYHYVSSPVFNAPVTEFADDMTLITGNPYFNNDTSITYAPFPTFFEYDETYPQPTLSLGWDDPGSIMPPLKGFAANFGSFTFSGAFDITGTTFNSGSQSINVTLTPSGNASVDGWNLIGNPYPSALDWDAPSGWNKGSLQNALYYFNPTDKYIGTYATYVNGIGTPSTTTGIISPMQAFLVKAAGTSSISVDNDARVHPLDNTFYKTATAQSIVRLSLENANGNADELVVYMDAQASLQFESSLDAMKFMHSDLEVPSFYSVSADMQNVCINAIPEIIYGQQQIIPLRAKVNRDGQFVIRVMEMLNLDPEVIVYLDDALTGQSINLNENPDYSFYATTNDMKNRFFLRISNACVTGVEDMNNELAEMYISGNTLFVSFMAENGQTADIILMDMSGRIITGWNSLEQGSHNFDLDVAKGLYQVRMISGGKSFVKRFFVN